MTSFVRLGFLVGAFLGGAAADAAVPANQYVYLQFQGGVRIPMSDSTSTQLPYGLGAGFRTGAHFVFGAFIDRSASSILVPSASVQVSNSFTTFGAEMQYYFHGSSEFIGGWSLGPKGGICRMGTKSQTTDGVTVFINESVSSFCIGPRIGYEYTSDLGMAFGFEASSLYSTDTAIPGILNFLMTARIWF
ncbi:MAG: hypothetical protein JNL01_02245 [Bdellovibrionales bacterium]|nr:hypothetical protein [Bdellovibrionales bacterium]